MLERNIKFTRVRKGYEPQEVEAVLTGFQKQIADLKQQNASLTNTMAQYEGKVRQLVENAKRLENEREKENQRLVGLLNQAAQIAEQTEQDALRKADDIINNAEQEAAGITEDARRETIQIVDNARREYGMIIENAKQEAGKIHAQAQIDFYDVEAMLEKLSENATSICKSNEQYIAALKLRLAEIDNSFGNVRNDGLEAPMAPQPSVFIPLTEGHTTALEEALG